MDVVLQLEDTRGMQLSIAIGSESHGCRLTVGGYSWDAVKYCYWKLESWMSSYSAWIEVAGRY